MKCKQKKAFLGALVGGLVGLSGSLVGGSLQSKAAKKQYREQLKASNKQATLQTAQNLTNAYGNQEYVDDFNKKITTDPIYKYGGKVKQKHKCKAENGGKFDTTSVINSAFNRLNDAIGGIFASDAMKHQQPVDTNPAFVGTPKEEIEKTDYAVNNPNTSLLLNNNLRIAKYGAKRKICKK